MTYCADEFNKTANVNFFENKKVLNRVRAYCEKAKKFLSSSENSELCIENLHAG